MQRSEFSLAINHVGNPSKLDVTAFVEDGPAEWVVAEVRHVCNVVAVVVNSTSTRTFELSELK